MPSNSYARSGNLRDLLDPVSEMPETLTPAASAEALLDGPIQAVSAAPPTIATPTTKQAQPARVGSPRNESFAELVKRRSTIYATALSAKEDIQNEVRTLRQKLEAALTRERTAVEDAESARIELSELISKGEQ